MKIAISQTRPIKGNIAANIDKHKTLIELASSLKANAIFFPELSLTSYEPKLAKALAINQDDKIYDDFQQISNINKITIGLGVPTQTKKGIQISMMIFQPNQTRQMYSKQQLHADELPYFENGDHHVILTIGNKKVAPAICYESLQSNHVETAIKLGAEIYIASVAKSLKGVERAMPYYSDIAKQYSMPVLMSNCVGYCDNFESTGMSSVWTKQGLLIGQLDKHSEGLIIF
jgi:predicted amidohydrolase